MININLPPLTADALRVLLEWWDDRATKADLAALKVELMASLQEILAKVQANTSLVESLNTLLDGVRQQVQEVLSGTVIPPQVQAQLDEVFVKLEEQRVVIADTVVENTPNQTP